MKRIAVVTPLFPIRGEPFRGQPVYLTVRELSRMAEVKVFCPQAAYPRARWLRPRSYVYHPPENDYRPPGTDVAYLEYPSVVLLGRFSNGLVCARRVFGEVQRWKPDLLLAYWLYPEGFAAVRIASRLGVPVVLGARGSDLRASLDPVSRFFTVKALRRAAGTLVVSEELRSRAVAAGVPPERVRTVLNGCDTSIFQPGSREEARRHLGIAPEAKLIVYVGHLVWAKGIGDLLAAVAEVAARYPELELVLVGDGQLEAKIPALAGGMGIGSKVRLVGKAQAPGVARWLAACDLFCLPSHAEGCPNVVIEALACGRPVVATTVGAIPEIVRDGAGILVPPGRPDALAAALSRCLETEWDAATISRIWRRGWEQVAAETLSFCKEVCG